MEFLSCEKCRDSFSEKCLPKILDCGHSVCLVCVAKLLHSEKKCPNCDVMLSKPLDMYLTNFPLLKISKSMLIKDSLLMDLASLEKKKRLVLSLKEISEKLIEIESSFKTAAEDFNGKFQELMQRFTELSNDSDVKNLVEDIDKHLVKMNKVLDHECNSLLIKMMYLNESHNKRLFLWQIECTFLNNKKIFVCEIVGNLLWKYGQITFNEVRFHVHCLSSSTPEKGSSVVLFEDLRKCMEPENNFTPFIYVGNQKLVFTLLDDTKISIWALQLSKYLTGEAGLILIGCKAEVTKVITSVGDQVEKVNFGSTKLNLCSISVPSSQTTCGSNNEFQYHETICTKIDRGDVVLQFFAQCIKIFRVPETAEYPAVVGKLQENCAINFNEMQGKKIEDCGISFF